MAYTVVKALLLALAAGSSVQGLSFGGSSSMSASNSMSASSMMSASSGMSASSMMSASSGMSASSMMSASSGISASSMMSASGGMSTSDSMFGFDFGSSFSLESSNLMQEFSSLTGFSSMSASTQRSICEKISRESSSGTINFVDIMGSCGSYCSQNSQAQSELISFLLAAQQKTSTKVIMDGYYSLAFQQLNLASAISQINANFYKSYSFCTSGIQSILASYIQSASSQTVINIDINKFSKVFGEYFVKSTVSELEAIIRALFQQVGCYKKITFTPASYYEVDVAAFVQMQKAFAESLKAKVQKIEVLDISSFRSLIGQTKTRYSGCQVCMREADALFSQFNGLIKSQSSQSSSAITSQINSAITSFESSSRFAFSSSSSSSFNTGSSSCTSCGGLLI